MKSPSIQCRQAQYPNINLPTSTPKPVLSKPMPPPVIHVQCKLPEVQSTTNQLPYLHPPSTLILSLCSRSILTSSSVNPSPLIAQLALLVLSLILFSLSLF